MHVNKWGVYKNKCSINENAKMDIWEKKEESYKEWQYGNKRVASIKDRLQEIYLKHRLRYQILTPYWYATKSVYQPID